MKILELKEQTVTAINSPNGAGLWTADENAEIC